MFIDVPMCCVNVMVGNNLHRRFIHILMMPVAATRKSTSCGALNHGKLVILQLDTARSSFASGF